MSPGPRAPWWYSGDDDEQAPEPVEPAAEQSTADGGQADEGTADEGAPSMDWMALVAGAARMVDWATERVMAPHAEHVDPADHPDCMVCRTVTLVGDPIGLMTTGQRPAQDPGPATADEDPFAPGLDAPRPDEIVRPGAEPIRWIPIVEPQD